MSEELSTVEFVATRANVVSNLASSVVDLLVKGGDEFVGVASGRLAAAQVAIAHLQTILDTAKPAKQRNAARKALDDMTLGLCRMADSNVAAQRPPATVREKALAWLEANSDDLVANAQSCTRFGDNWGVEDVMDCLETVAEQADDLRQVLEDAECEEAGLAALWDKDVKEGLEADERHRQWQREQEAERLSEVKAKQRKVAAKKKPKAKA